MLEVFIGATVGTVVGVFYALGCMTYDMEFREGGPVGPPAYHVLEVELSAIALGALIGLAF